MNTCWHVIQLYAFQITTLNVCSKSGNDTVDIFYQEVCNFLCYGLGGINLMISLCPYCLSLYRSFLYTKITSIWCLKMSDLRFLYDDLDWTPRVQAIQYSNKTLVQSVVSVYGNNFKRSISWTILTKLTCTKQDRNYVVLFVQSHGNKSR